ncbi:MAG: hypothetical protein A2900_04155 [Candidatus Chisholmbacteria bacterium RIFCSPLOWO2_01_FULL_50_28]|uniref:Phage holin family protein n=1 Tax=Candidatus Chisholmbacteria bacterium RIFCSPHIGHO2_01_FULL_52_32 TaxID=1797591 RepID=A0A1G1VT31_9BACT|nr:MAG: hypothetical protein A2786_02590 [Candidatus Chisholmbacteria bacterium RIFCSPHIGHO2_01_FULL_52_32]OGY20262.1 MAG: hypothetical protein A2900_04155 [Candidatus Chisholmbacteria bacterium RIFCSPLOWO2_01_FULL_50_28]
MKSLLRSFIISLASLQSAILLIPGVSNNGGTKSLVLATLVLGLMNRLIRPLISLLLLPVNLITMGAFRWIVNVMVLFLLTLAVSQIKITSFTFPGYTFRGFVMPELEVTKFWTLVVASLTISLTSSFLIWVSSEE